MSAKQNQPKAQETTDEHLHSEEHKHLHAIIDQGPIGIVTVSMQGQFLSVNPYVCRMLGYTEEEMKQKKFADITYPETIQKDVDALKKIVSGALAEYRTEKRYLRKDKSIAWARIAVSVIRDSQGKPLHLLTFIEDISGEKKTKDELAESEQRYRAIVDNSPDGIIIHQQGKFLYANQQALLILGAEKEEQIIGKSALDFVHPDSRKAVIERIKMMAANPQTALAPLEEKYIRLNDGTVDVEVKAAPIIYHGNPAVLVIARDIGERKKAEKLLQDSENKYRILAELSPDCIKIFDLELRLQYMNKAGRLEHGVEEKQDISSWNFLTSIDKQFLPAVQNAIKDVKSGKTATVEIKHDADSCSKDSPIGCGARGWCLATFAPIPDEQGKIKAIFGVSRDITDMKNIIENMKKAEYDLKTRNSELEELNKIMMGRELRIVELKQEIETLKKKF